MFDGNRYANINVTEKWDGFYYKRTVLCFSIFNYNFDVPYSRDKNSIFLLFVPLLATKFCLQVRLGYGSATVTPALQCLFVIFALFYMWKSSDVRWSLLRT
jgi:hypothetical protein